MSAKSTKQGKKLSVPRPMADIQAEYQRQCANAGQLQYQLKIQTRELERINSQLEALNNEGAARMQLDKDAAARQSTVDTSTSQSQAV